MSAKRSFLEKKGLTEAEINEAFKRVPETAASAVPAAPVPATTSTPTYGASNLVTYTQQAPAAGQPATTAGAAPQPLAAAPGAGALVPIHPQQQLQAMQPVQQPMRWSQVSSCNGLLHCWLLYGSALYSHSAAHIPATPGTCWLLLTLVEPNLSEACC